MWFPSGRLSPFCLSPLEPVFASFGGRVYLHWFSRVSHPFRFRPSPYIRVWVWSVVCLVTSRDDRWMGFLPCWSVVCFVWLFPVLFSWALPFSVLFSCLGPVLGLPAGVVPISSGALGCVTSLVTHAEVGGRMGSMPRSGGGTRFPRVSCSFVPVVLGPFVRPDTPVL